MEGVQGAGQNVWHDDGTADGQAEDHPMYQRDKADDVSTFKDLPATEAVQVSSSILHLVSSLQSRTPMMRFYLLCGFIYMHQR